ncbi:MAG: diguanylate cyclase [Vicinamibacteria bacterium]
MTEPEDEPTLVPNPSALDRSIRALMSVVDDLTVSLDEAGVLRATLEHVVEALGAAGGATYMPGPDDAPVVVALCGAPAPDPEELADLVRMAVQWERPVHRDLAGAGWAAATPLVAKERVLGAMALHDPARGRPPDRELLRALGMQVGMGVENARLYAELRAGAARIEVLGRIGRTLIASLDIKKAVGELARELSAIHPFDRLACAFVNDTGDYLEVIAHPAEEGWGLGGVLPVVGSGPGFCVLNERPVVERDLLKNHRFIEDMRLLEEGIRSYLLLPLQTRGRAIGALCLASRREDAFDDALLARLQPLTAAAALALDNLRLLQKTKEQSVTDDLTPLYNARFFQQMLEREMKLADRYKLPLSIAFFDLDRFKPVNDRYGHLRGSRVLREVGFLLRAAVRETDYPVRWGGDEFVILLPQTDADAALKLAERIQAEVEQHVFLQEEGIDVQVGASFGTATYPSEAQTKEALVRLADERMYANKGTRKTEGT